VLDLAVAHRGTRAWQQSRSKTYRRSRTRSCRRESPDRTTGTVRPWRAFIVRVRVRLMGRLPPLCTTSFPLRSMSTTTFAGSTRCTCAAASARRFREDGHARRLGLGRSPRLSRSIASRPSNSSLSEWYSGRPVRSAQLVHSSYSVGSAGLPLGREAPGAARHSAAKGCDRISLEIPGRRPEPARRSTQAALRAPPSLLLACN
jgi:hypothetical protein